MRCGCDLVAVPRLARLLERHPGARERLFTPGERADAVRGGVAVDDPVALRRLAARFAAKEATVKALGRPRLRWHDIEIRTAADGGPQLWLGGRHDRDLAVSLTHDGDHAMAFVVLATSELASPAPV